MKSSDNPLLEYNECTTDIIESQDGTDTSPIVCTKQQWAMGLQRSGLLCLIHLSHFGRLVKANACAKKPLVCFHDGYLWLDR